VTYGRATLLLAIETLPVSSDEPVRQDLLDRSVAVSMALAREAEGLGYLERASAYRMITRALMMTTPLDLDTDHAAHLHAAVEAVEAPDACQRVRALLGELMDPHGESPPPA
jgi:hypothetical protein